MLRRVHDVPHAIILALVLVIQAFAAPVSSAQDAGNGTPKIAVIDMQKIMRESEAVQSIQRQIEQQRSEYQEQLRQKEQQLRTADEELTRQRSVLSSDAFQKKRRELEEQVGTLQRDIQSSKRQLDQNYSKAMKSVQQKLVEIVGDIASKRNLDMVIGKTTVVLVKPELDITDAALERLNATVTSVDVQSLEQ